MVNKYFYNNDYDITLKENGKHNRFQNNYNLIIIAMNNYNFKHAQKSK